MIWEHKSQKKQLIEWRQCGKLEREWDHWRSRNGGPKTPGHLSGWVEALEPLRQGMRSPTKMTWAEHTDTSSGAPVMTMPIIWLTPWGTATSTSITLVLPGLTAAGTSVREGSTRFAGEAGRGDEASSIFECLLCIRIYIHTHMLANINKHIFHVR